MATLFKEVSYNLATLIQQIDMGIIGLADIQQPFVWADTDHSRQNDSFMPR
jgi:hypothetical protein